MSLPFYLFFFAFISVFGFLSISSVFPFVPFLSVIFRDFPFFHLSAFFRFILRAEKVETLFTRPLLRKTRRRSFVWILFWSLAELLEIFRTCALNILALVWFCLVFSLASSFCLPLTFVLLLCFGSLAAGAGDTKDRNSFSWLSFVFDMM